MWSSLALAGLIPAAIVLFVLWLLPSDQFLLLPDTPHLAADVVNVQGEKATTGPGSLYFVDVRERRASQLEVDFPRLAPGGATFIPAVELLGPGVSESQNQSVALQEMARSQRITVTEYFVGMHRNRVRQLQPAERQQLIREVQRRA